MSLINCCAFLLLLLCFYCCCCCCYCDTLCIHFSLFASSFTSLYCVYLYSYSLISGGPQQIFFLHFSHSLTLTLCVDFFLQYTLHSSGIHHHHLIEIFAFNFTCVLWRKIFGKLLILPRETKEFWLLLGDNLTDKFREHKRCVEN